MQTTEPTKLEILPGVKMLGRLIGKYRVVREIGRGGMGIVFEAVHEEIGQRAAVKVMHAELTIDQKVVRRFFDEARAVTAVEHPGLVKLFDYNRLSDGTLYILMEFLSGQSLHERMNLRGGPMPLPEALRVTRQISSTLQAVHERGIVHRDLKPDNVFLVRDPDSVGGERVKVVDFGIAKFQEGDGDRRTTEGKMLGTPEYMAPEQCQGTQVDSKVDVYSLGVILYEMLCGRTPFYSPNWIQIVVVSHVNEVVPPLRERAPETPEEVAVLVHAMLSKDPATRPSMADVIERIDGFDPGLRGFSASQPLVRSVPQLQVPSVPARPRAPWLAGGVALALLLGVGLWAVFGRGRPPVPAPHPAVASPQVTRPAATDPSAPAARSSLSIPSPTASPSSAPTPEVQSPKAAAASPGKTAKPTKSAKATPGRTPDDKTNRPGNIKGRSPGGSTGTHGNIPSDDVIPSD